MTYFQHLSSLKPPNRRLLNEAEAFGSSVGGELRRSETPVNQGFNPLQLYFWQTLKRCNTLGVGVAFFPPTDFSTTPTAAADSNYTAETCANRPRSSLDTGDLQQHGRKERRQLCRFWRTVATKHRVSSFMETMCSSASQKQCSYGLIASFQMIFAVKSDDGGQFLLIDIALRGCG